MDERTTGIILRTRPFTETSLIVHWLTRDFGRLSTVAKGARRPKSPFRGKLDLFYLAEFSFHQSRRSELHTLKEVSIREFHEPLRLDVTYLQQASYFVQLVEQTTEINTPLPGLFELVAQALTALRQSKPSPLTVHAFEMKLLDALGLSPDLSQTRLSAGSREILNRLRVSDWALLPRLKISVAQGGELEEFLRGFLTFHLGALPQSRPASCRVGGKSEIGA